MSTSDPEKFAEHAGLTYVSENSPGYTRKKVGRGFAYFDDKKKITSKSKIKRFQNLKIPPAWKEVWISKDPCGHIQVTGLDQKGRKQYLYHEEWLKLRNITKYDEMYEFGRSLPQIRQKVREHLQLKGLPREKVLATVVVLLEEAMIRVGNRAYAKENQSFGITTLRRKHLDINGTNINFQFKAKSGKYQDINIRDRKLAHILKKCNELPGYEIFKYIDEEGNKHFVDSGDVNEYIQEISGKYFTAKYFRTWGGSIKALEEYEIELEGEENKDKRKSKLTQVIKRVSKSLNNTVSICRDYYIHPSVIELIEEEKQVDFENVKPVEENLSDIENYFLRLIKRKKREKLKEQQ